VEIAQKDGSTKERTTYRLAGSYRPCVTCGSPLVRNWRQALRFPQNLQDSLCSDITFCHQIDSLFEQSLKSFPSHLGLPSLFRLIVPCCADLVVQPFYSIHPADANWRKAAKKGQQEWAASP
jgi:hypothetical protein